MKSTQQQGRATGSLGIVAILTVGLLLGGATAQNTKSQDTKSQDTKSQDTKSQDTKSQDTELQDKVLARIEVATTHVRCFASLHSPVYEDVLAKGAVVEVGKATGEFRQVRLPMGVVGYVSKKFTSTPENGLLQTTGDRVSFRYRPTPKRRAEQPVARLSKGTELKFLGEQGSWWKVRLATDAAYLPIKDLQVFQAANTTLSKSYAELARWQDAEWRGAVQARQAAVASLAKTAAQTERFDGIRGTYAKELTKQPLDQRLEPILVELGKLVGDLPEGAPLLAAAQRLEQAVRTQGVLVQAKRLLATTPPPGKVPDVKEVETPIDPLAHLQYIGWLTYHPRSRGAAAFRLTKGGKVVRYLKCSSMRYDLSMFHGVEVGVTGQARQDDLRSYLEVEKIIVLGHAR